MEQLPSSPRQRQRGFSFRSDKSGSSKGKVDLTESPQEKARRDSIWKNSSKANPNAALSEAQPGGMYDPSLISFPLPVAPASRQWFLRVDISRGCPWTRGRSLSLTWTSAALNLLEESTLQSLRDIQHKDINGNPIRTLTNFQRRCHILTIPDSRPRSLQSDATAPGTPARHHSIVRESN